jgi:hypothetical protein
VLAVVAVTGVVFVAGRVKSDGDGGEEVASSAAPVATPTGSGTTSTRPAARGTPVGGAGKLNDLSSYRFAMRIEGSGGPLEGVASTFQALQTGTPDSRQDLVMEVNGAFVKPDRGQQTLKLGTFNLDITTIGKQQWTRVFGIQTGPESAARTTEDYSFAASIWDEGLVDSFSALGCTGTDRVNGVAVKKCGVDSDSLGALIDAFGGLSADPTSGIRSITGGSMEAWLAQQGNYPVRINVNLAGTGSDNKAFKMKLSLDVTEINSTAIRINPPSQ